MSRVNNKQMKALVAAFMERVTSGAPIDDTWRSRMAAVAPELPEHPTPAQIEAWTELAGMLQDQDVMREFQAGVSTFWDGAQDAVAYREAAVDGYQAADAAIARGVAATDPDGIAIGRTWPTSGPAPWGGRRMWLPAVAPAISMRHPPACGRACRNCWLC